ncbi:chemotaxis protein CheA [Flagellatimonas centrodinii]|uniref:chemotaxis protein CheA n=1 Tax=Flagellatimonas centrodinii TaxID=2806210 RepID=UPI001FFC9440|nr:chemotaxis protein CheA [Flagellatimonas centrodinii]ULQ45658.1 chemotaxis protein CheA [Flagellatimonas centrodinii]
MGTADPSLLPDFLTEAGELLERLGDDVFALAEDPGGDRLNAVFRGFHTIKGGASFLGLDPVVSLCHRAEDAFGRVRDGQLQISPELVDAALDAVKVLDQQIALLHDGAPLSPAPATVLAALDALLGTTTVDTINEDEFEALLDQLHGSGAAPEGPPAVAAPAAPAAVPAPAAGAAATSTRAPEATVRVDSERIDHLMTLVGELVIVRNRLKAHAEPTPGAAGLMGELDRVTMRLQNAVMRVRMQPVGRLFSRFPRMVRDLARELGKQVNVELVGEDTDLDKHLVDALADPMIHLVRNALDHGIEAPEQRNSAGKNPVGRLLLSASQRGDSVILRVEDDGRGLDPDAIRASAVRKGLLDERAAAALTPAQACELILRPGFSTRDAVSSVSGRGVGMDVVASTVRALGGRLVLSGTPGQGAAVELVLPLTLAILPTLRTRCGSRSLGLPLRQVIDLQPFDSAQVQLRAGRPMLSSPRCSLPVLFLDTWLGLPQGARRLLVRVSTHHGDRALVVDSVEGREDVVLKPPGRLLRGVPGYGGAAVTGDGRIALILDPDGLAALHPEL